MVVDDEAAAWAAAERCLDAVRTCARVSYNHPLRPDAPREVLSFSFREGRSSVLAAAHARVALELLHRLALYRPNEFPEAMRQLEPWRRSYLVGKDLPSDAFPLLQLEIASAAELRAADVFVMADVSSDVTGNDDFAAAMALFSTEERQVQVPIPLFVQLHVPEDEHQQQVNDILTPACRLMELLLTSSPGFELMMVDLDLSEVEIHDNATAYAVADLCRLALAHTMAFRVHVGLPSPWSLCPRARDALFLAICRVGCARSAESLSALNVSWKPLSRTSLESIATGEDPVDAKTAFLMALSSNVGYRHLTIRNLFDGVADPSIRRRIAYWFGLAVLSPARTCSWKSLRWSETDLLVNDVDVMKAAATCLAPHRPCVHFSNAEDSIDVSQDQLAATRVECIRGNAYSEHVGQLDPSSVCDEVDHDAWSLQQDSPHLKTVQTESLEELHLEINSSHPETQRSFQILIPLLGAVVTKLHVDFVGEPVSAQSFVNIFESCVHLRHVTVSNLEVPRDDVDVYPERIVSRRLVKLFISMHHSDADVRHPAKYLDRLLPHIGHSLEYLEIRKRERVVFFHEEFEAIVHGCARLFHLKLEHLDIGSLNPLQDAYLHRKSRISSLYLLKSPVDEDSLCTFAAFLGKPDLPQTRMLRVFHINHFDRVNAPELTALTHRSLHSLLCMLEKNKTLTELYLGVPDRSDPDTPLRPMKPRFRQYDDQEIPVAAAQLSVQSKLAFLSALQLKSLPWNPEVFSLITLFAANRVRRAVQFDIVSFN